MKTKQLKSLSFLVFFSLLYTNISYSQEKKESFYDQISRGVIRLEHINSYSIIPDTIPDGTAFFCRKGDELYIVTARHVAEKNYNMQARVSTKNRLNEEIEVLLLKLFRDRWIYHTDNGDSETHYVDVAAQRLAWIIDRDIKAFQFELRESENYNLNLFAEEDPLPPQPILSFGFPSNIGFELEEQRPFGRDGIVAMVAGEKFLKFKNGKYANHKNIILDSNIFDGNSGSPVIKYLDKPILLGLIVATNLKYNYAIMEPVSRIKEVLEITEGQSIENLACWFTL